MRKLIVAVLLLAITSCAIGKETSSIYVENNSGQLIDSVVINANGYYLIKVYKIASGQTKKREVNSKDVKGTHHIKMVPVIYVGGKAVQAAYFYNDLSGFEGNYKVSIDEQMTVKWEILK